MFILNRHSMGGYTPGGPDKVITQANIGGCWCGQSYFHHRIASSGGSNVILWKFKPRPSACRLKAPPPESGAHRIPDSLRASPPTKTIIRSFGPCHGPTIRARPTFPCLHLRGNRRARAFLIRCSRPRRALGRIPEAIQPRARGGERQSLCASYKQLSIFGMH